MSISLTRMRMDWRVSDFRRRPNVPLPENILNPAYVIYCGPYFPYGNDYGMYRKFPVFKFARAFCEYYMRAHWYILSFVSHSRSVYLQGQLYAIYIGISI